MDDQRMVGWSALCRKDASYSRGIFSIRPKTVDGLGGKGDEPTVAQCLHSPLHGGKQFLGRKHTSSDAARRP